jgi:hypothetical protein
MKVWRSKRPDKTFFRMSVEDFGKIIGPSGEAREALATLCASTQQALARRNEADSVTRRAVLRVVNAIKGDADEGEDSDLLAEMGYLPHTAKTGIISAGRRNALKVTQTPEDEKESADEEEAAEDVGSARTSRATSERGR